MSSSFRSILQEVTQEKLEELKIQKNLTTNHFKPILTKIAKRSVSPLNALHVLYNAIRDNPIKDNIDNKDAILMENLKYVLQNAEDDPSISSQLVLAWVKKVKQEIKYVLRKCDYSYLYGSLLSEWLELEERKSAKKTVAAEMDVSPGLSDVQTKGQLDKKAATDEIKSLMFSQPSSDDFDANKFRRFLSEDLFYFGDSAEGQSIMKKVQKESEDYFKTDSYHISTYDVKCCIKGLRSMDLLSNEKKEALNELNENSEALTEVASLLTNRLRNLNRWEWPTSCEKVEIRRGLAGEYKPFMNENIITALFLQYVGVQWASYFKRQFLSLYHSKVWTRSRSDSFSIESKRKEFHETTFLSGLPDSMSSQNNEIEEEYAKVESQVQLQRSERIQPVQSGSESYSSYSASSRIAETYSRAYPESYQESYQARYPVTYPGAGGGGVSGAHYSPSPPVSKIDFKQAFLHNLSTEIRLNQVIHPDKALVVVQADLESFGPSIIHNAALIAFEYLGVSKQWLEFFEKFLQPRVSFDESEEPKKIVRGVPTSHVLSSLFGETLLFLLDFLINQKCNGMRIYRISDEFWFWNHVAEDVTKAWETMIEYGKMVGLNIKENRSGSVAVFSDQMLSQLPNQNEYIESGPTPLPQRSIHWGYLELHSNGIFKIDQKSIAKFLKEMQDLLDKSECVLEWINVFNKYFAFFIRNFGKCALVSGKQHLDQIISSLRTIYTGLFGSENGNPVEKLKSRFDKLKEADIVDVWVYWPLERGGLGLVNPFIGIMSLHAAYVDINDDDHFTKLPLEDKVLWEEIVNEYVGQYGSSSLTVSYEGSYPGRQVTPKPPTWDEYLAKRETELSHWCHRYRRLLDRPGPKTPSVSDSYRKLDSPLPKEELEKNYLMWLFTYYETQLVLHFGSVKFINSKLLPMSMIASIQKTKVQY